MSTSIIEDPARVEEVPDAAPPRSRRALLSGAAGGVAALVALLTRPLRSEAAAGSPIILGSQVNNAGTSDTQVIANSGFVTFKLLQNGPGTGLMGYATAPTGGTRGMYGRSDSPDGDGVQARNAGATGSGAAIRAFGGQNHGVVVTSDSNLRNAVSATNLQGVAINAYSQMENGVACWSDLNSALSASGGGGTKLFAAIKGHNSNASDGMAAYLTNNSAFATAHLYNGGSGQVLWLQNGGSDAAGTGGGDFIVCRNEDQSDTQFRVATDGTAYSDTSFNGGGADFAELMPAAGPSEPGDVLAVQPDGRLGPSSEARSGSVMGVHSTQPGFLAGASAGARRQAGRIPLAVVGIVPVKASAENGAIRAGDRLVSASLPGHAMRADDHPEVGTVIGKALASLAAGTGSLQMLVMLQ